MFFGVSTHLGGAERSLLEFLLQYNRDPERSDFFVLLPKADGPLIDALVQNKIAYHVLPLPEWILKLTRKKRFAGLAPTFATSEAFAYLRELKNLIAHHQVGTIHCTGIKCHIIACLLSPFIPARVIVHFRDILPPALARFFNLFRRKKQITWLAASKAIGASTPRISPQVVYDGFDESVFKPARTSFLKDHFQIPPGAPLFGLVGVVTRWKGQREFLLAAKQVADENPDCHFVVVGDQIYDTAGEEDFLLELKELRRELGLSSRFHFLGFQKNTVPIYNSLDWLVHASVQPEPFGRVLVEAMLCHTPVIASGAGGVLEIVEDGRTGLLHTPGDVNSLAQTMEKALLINEAEKQIWIQAAADFCRRSFSLGERYTELKQILEKI
jgi:glycosyltransferase involved in cell wall biosynthesis